jgi:uncharacterized membrane-anchored protein YjiN (DUF445 family)
MTPDDPTLTPVTAAGRAAPDDARTGGGASTEADSSLDASFDAEASAEIDALRRRRLTRNRALATSMLTAMGAVFVATHLVPEPGFLTLLTRAGAEAGMVGGIADWFAVTALFRRPLGLPIPHTAIIPTNKDRIGRTLGRFVESNFLTPEVLLPKLRQLEAGRRAAAWLAEPESAGLIARSVTSVLPRLLGALQNRDLHDFVQRAFGDAFSRLDVAPAIAHVVRALTASGEADVLFDRALGVAIRWIADNRDELDQLIRQRSRWWIPKSIDRRIAAAILDALTDLLTDLQDKGSDARTKFRAALDGLVTDLLDSPAQRAQVNDAAQRLLAHPDTRGWLASVWIELCAAAAADLAQPRPRLAAAIETPVSLIARTLAADAVMQQYIDGAVERIALWFIGWRTEIGAFIAEVVRNWDTRTLVERLELVVGSDLQYIRMNGTIVGACAGCLIFLVTRALS